MNIQRQRQRTHPSFARFSSAADQRAGGRAARMPHITIGAVFRGVWPFAVSLVVLLAVMVAFPELALWLPRSMK